MKEALNKDAQMFSACRAAMFDAAQPLFTRAQQAGEIRADVAFDDVLRMVSGIVAASYVDDEPARPRARDRARRAAREIGGAGAAAAARGRAARSGA